MAAFLADGEGRGPGEAAQLAPHALPLDGVAGLPDGKLQAQGRHLPLEDGGRPPGLSTRPPEVTNGHVRPGSQANRLRSHSGAGGKAGAPLTLYSADTPLSVSRRELQGNCPVTLYKFTEKLGDKGTEL